MFCPIIVNINDFFIFISLTVKRPPPPAQAQYKKTGDGHPWIECNKKDQWGVCMIAYFFLQIASNFLWPGVV